ATRKCLVIEYSYSLFAMRLDPMLQSAPSPAVIAVPAPPVTGCGFPGKTAIAIPQAGRVPPDAAVMQGGSAPAGQVFASSNAGTAVRERGESPRRNGASGSTTCPPAPDPARPVVPARRRRRSSLHG